MKTVRMKIEPAALSGPPVGRVDAARLDATTEADLEAQAILDGSQAMQDAGQFARRVRRRLGLTQVQFATRIDVPLETIRNWEQGKRSPTGAAKALLKVLDKAPEAALAALH
jgi:putative transcriptional regulator